MKFLRRLFVFGCLPLIVLLFAAAVFLFRPWAWFGRVPAERLIPPSASAIGIINAPLDLARLSFPAREHGSLENGIAAMRALDRNGTPDPSLIPKSETDGVAVGLRVVALLTGSHVRVIFASWPDEESETGEYSSPMLLVPEERPWTAHLDRLIRRTAREGALIEEKHAGRRILAVVDDETGDAVAWTRVGGWVAVVPQAVSLAPLRATIDRYYDEDAPEADRATPAEIESCASPGLAFVADRASFASQLREFLRERGMEDDEIDETPAGNLSRMVEAERIVVTAGGAAAEDGLPGGLEIRFQGKGLAGLPWFETGSSPGSGASAGEARRPDPPAASDADPAPSIFQFDATYAFATGGADRLGLRWNDWLDALAETDWLQPGFADGLRRRLDPERGEPARRVGWALYPTLNDPVPVAAIWADADDPFTGAGSPADAWRLRSKSEIEASGDARVILGVREYSLPDDAAGDAAARSIRSGRALSDQVWSTGNAPPIAFGVLHFDQLADSLEAFPAVVLNDRGRDEWRGSIRGARMLEALFGSLAARLDREGEDLVLRVRSR